MRNARWDDVDLEGRVGTVPETATKFGRMRRVPLADRKVEVLEEIGVPAVPHEVAEAALAHVVKDSTEAAYARSTMF